MMWKQLIFVSSFESLVCICCVIIHKFYFLAYNIYHVIFLFPGNIFPKKLQLFINKECNLFLLL